MGERFIDATYRRTEENDEGIVDTHALVSSWYVAMMAEKDVATVVYAQKERNGSFMVLGNPEELTFSLFFAYNGEVQRRALEVSGDGRSVRIAGCTPAFPNLSALVYFYSSPWTPENRDLPCNLDLSPTARRELKGYVPVELLEGGAGPKDRRSENVEEDEEEGSTAEQGEPLKVQDVLDWLEEIHFAQYKRVFRERHIDGVALLRLEDADLARMGVEPSDRPVLLRHIRSLKPQVKEVGVRNVVARPRRRTFIVKEINGKPVTFDADTGEEVKDMSSAIASQLRDIFPDSSSEGKEFEWCGDDLGWVRHTPEGRIRESEWDVDDVCAWLAHARLNDCIPVFQTRGITGIDLKEAEVETLMEYGRPFGLSKRMKTAAELFQCRAIETDTLSHLDEPLPGAQPPVSRGIPHAQIDGHARKAPWFCPGVPESQATAPLMDPTAPEGDFVVFEDLSEGVLKIALITPAGLNKASILHDQSGHLHMEGSRMYFSSLSELVYTFASNNEEKPWLLRIPDDPNGHTSASWFKPSLSEEQANGAVEFQRDGTFFVRETRPGEYAIHSSDRGTPRVVSVTQTGSGFVADRSEEVFPALANLVNHYTFVQPNDLNLYLEQFDIGAPGQEAAAGSSSTAAAAGILSRIDPAAMSSDYWLGEISESEASRIIRSVQPGTFKVRIDPNTHNSLWLDELGEDRFISSSEIVNTPQGLMLQGDARTFECLSDLVEFHKGQGAPNAKIKGTSGAALWYHAKLTELEAEEALACAPNGGFLIRNHDRAPYALDYVCGGRVHHVLITSDNDGGLGLERCDTRFGTLEALVDYYTTTPSRDIKCLLRVVESVPRGKPTFWDQRGVDKVTALESIRYEPTGAFVVRSSESRPECSVLSYVYEGCIYHEFIVSASDDAAGEQGVRLERSVSDALFPDLKALIEFYSRLHPDLPCELRLGDRRPERGFDSGRERNTTATFASSSRTRSGRDARSAQRHVTSSKSMSSSRRTPHWLQTEVSKSSALDMLVGAPEGSFIIRSSESSPGFLVLCYIHNNEIFQEYIAKTNGLYYLELDPENRFEGLDILVEFYARGDTVLAAPLSLQSTHRSRSHRTTFSTIGSRSRSAGQTISRRQERLYEGGGRETLTLESQHRASESILQHPETLRRTNKSNGTVKVLTIKGKGRGSEEHRVATISSRSHRSTGRGW